VRYCADGHEETPPDERRERMFGEPLRGWHKYFRKYLQCVSGPKWAYETNIHIRRGRITLSRQRYLNLIALPLGVFPLFMIHPPHPDFYITTPNWKNNVSVVPWYLPALAT